MNTKRKNKIGATQYIALGFLAIILVGTILLRLPISHVGKLSTFDALFVATSATCVTGYSTVVVADTFTIFRTVYSIVLNTNWWASALC